MPATPTGTSRHGHFFESSGHGVSVVRSIGEGVLPLRYAYAGSAAYAHDRLAESDGYRSVIGSVELALRALEADPGAAAAVARMVEIAPGSGVQTVALLGSLTDRGMRCRSYLGLDFSATLLGLACDRIHEAFGSAVALQSAVWDMEAGRSARIERWRVGLGRDGPVLACLLGHTLGSVESAGQVLEHIHGSLRPGDVLLTAAALQTPDADPATVMEPYRTEDFRAAALEPLRAAGVAADHVKFDVRFDDGAVIGEVVFVRKVRVGSLIVPSGHVLRCFRSRRFAVSDVLSLLERTGFQIRTAIVGDSQEQAIAMAVRA